MPGVKPLPWIQTYSGIRFDVLDPKPDQICIEDIAHALSLICRFNGHTKFPYSVAQHCVLMSDIIPEFKFEALMHDCAETWYTDIPKPFKIHLPDFNDYENRVLKQAARRFGFQFPFAQMVHDYDFYMLIAEKLVLFETELEWPFQKHIKQLDIEIEERDWQDVEQEFLEKFRALTPNRTQAALQRERQIVVKTKKTK